MMSNNIPLDARPLENTLLSGEENLTFRVNPVQLEQLCKLGVVDEAQAAAGRKAGGLQVSVSARLVRQFQQENEANTAALEKLAHRIHDSGMAIPARLFLVAGRPLSFFGSQVLLLAQPASKLLFKAQDPTAQYSRLLEDRANVDRLLRRLDTLEREKKLAQPQLQPGSKVSGFRWFSNKKERTRL
jgi:hypothetical protein